MKNKKILLAGGAGYIGSVLSPYLEKKGYDITVIDSCWFGNYLPDSIKLLKQDLYDLTVNDLKEYTDIVFLGGLSNDPMAEFSPQENFNYNCALPAYLGFLAREAGIKRYIFASSCSVYGFTDNKVFTETDKAICNYPYGVSKLQGEQALLSLQTDSFSVICLRQGTVSGYSPRMRLDLAINTMFKNAISKHEITLSNHQIWRPILALPDLCKGYEAALISVPETNGIFNIASFNTTVGELADGVVNQVKKKFNIEIKVTDKKIQDFRNYKVSWQKAMDELGYLPTQSLDDIVLELSNNLEKFSDFENPNFYNIDVFKQIMLSKHRITI